MAGLKLSDLKFYDVSTRPTVGDIVWSKWPLREKPREPGPWTRAVLVVHVQLFEVEIIEGKPETKVQYARVTAQYGGDYKFLDLPKNLLIKSHEFRALGLHKPTLFRMDTRNRRSLPWCDPYFVSQGYVRAQKIIAGHLDEDQMQRMEVCFNGRGLTFPIPDVK
jgi:hypothetical protein